MRWKVCLSVNVTRCKSLWCRYATAGPRAGAWPVWCSVRLRVLGRAPTLCCQVSRSSWWKALEWLGHGIPLHKVSWWNVLVSVAWLVFVRILISFISVIIITFSVCTNFIFDTESWRLAYQSKLFLFLQFLHFFFFSKLLSFIETFPL